MMDVTAQIAGVEDLQRALKQLGADLPAQLQPLLLAEAQALASIANAEVPRESGELAASSFTDSATTKTGAISVAGYTDPKAPAVHEGFHGGKKVSLPNLFWLQRAANQFAPGFAGRIAAHIRSALGL
jgi:hypothetical protein